MMDAVDQTFFYVGDIHDPDSVWYSQIEEEEEI